MSSSSAQSSAAQARGPFLAHLRAALERHGQLERVRKRLTPAACTALDGAGPDQWVDERLVVEVLDTARRGFGDDARWRALLREESAAAIQRFYRVFLRHVTPGMLFLALPRMWSLTHATGTLGVRWLDARRVRVEYRDHPPLLATAYQELTVAVLDALLALNRTRATVEACSSPRPDERFEVEVRMR